MAAPSAEDIVSVISNVAKKEGCNLPNELAHRIAEKSNRNLRCGLKSFIKRCALAVAAAAVAQLVERPPLRFLKEVQLSDLSSNPGRGIRW